MISSKPRKIAALRKEVLKSKSSEPTGPHVIRLADVRRDPLFQVRRSLVTANVRRLRAAYQSGKKVTPILVAFVGEEEQPFVLDGHHRCQALEDIGEEVVEALAFATSRRDARWVAAKANTEHGEPLTFKERREVFRTFISSRKHVLADGASMSYQEIATELGDKKHTIYTWMKLDFPALYRKMGREDVPSASHEKPPRALPVLDPMADFKAHLHALRDAFERAHSDQQAEVMRMTRTMLAHFQERHDVTLEEESPFRSPRE